MRLDEKGRVIHPQICHDPEDGQLVCVCGASAEAQKAAFAIGSVLVTKASAFRRG